MRSLLPILIIGFFSISAMCESPTDDEVPMSFDWQSLPNASIRVYLVGYLANIYQRGGGYRDRDKNTKNSLDTGLGAGPGAEFFFNRYFAVHAELPWMTFVKTTNDSLSFRDSYPHFGGGFIYYF